MDQTPPPDFLPIARANAVLRKLRAAFAKPRVAVRFTPSQETAKLAYFPADLDASLRALAPPGLDLAAVAAAAGDDVAIVTAHGSDVSSMLWSLRLGGFAGTVVAWHWDNHLGPTTNLSTAIAADVVVPSHGIAASSLTNPVSIRTAPVHACAAQWTVAEAGTLFDRFGIGVRDDRLFAPYVDYPFRQHAQLLHDLPRHMAEVEVLLMPPGDRSRYFGQSRERRFAEWAARKVSLILPIANDLSTRVFDALLAGQTLVAPADLPDLDVVIPPDLQREFGIARFDRPDPVSIRDAWKRALAAFDSGGVAGARRRHDFVRGAHMLEHRVLAICDSLRRLADGTLAVRFGREPDSRAGLIADGT